MLQLAKDTVDDSVTVRVVTLVTLIYLPASFVAVGAKSEKTVGVIGDSANIALQSLLGTNLFIFQTDDGSGFQVSPQFWIFIVLSVPLTVLTIGSWFFIIRRRNKKRTLEGYQNLSIYKEA